MNDEQRLEFLTTHPYEFTCGDERHVNRYGERTYFALADDAQIPNLNRLRKGVYRAALGSETIVP